MNLGNLNKTGYNPNVLITLPSNMTFLGATGGTSKSISVNSPTSLTWNPQLNNKVSTASVSFKVEFTTATTGSNVNITARESLNGTTKTTSFNINPVVIEDTETVEGTSTTTDVTTNTDPDGNLILDLPTTAYETVNTPFTLTVNKDDMELRDNDYLLAFRDEYEGAVTITSDETGINYTIAHNTYPITDEEGSPLRDYFTLWVYDWNDETSIDLNITFTNTGKQVLTTFTPLTQEYTDHYFYVTPRIYVPSALQIGRAHV